MFDNSQQPESGSKCVNIFGNEIFGVKDKQICVYKRVTMSSIVVNDKARPVGFKLINLMRCNLLL